MKYLLDENISHLHAVHFRNQQYDVISVVEIGLAGSEDLKVREVSDREDRVLITLDLDFSNITRRALIPRCGVIILRLKHPTESLIQNMLTKLFAASHNILGAITIMDDDNIRIRSL